MKDLKLSELKELDNVKLIKIEGGSIFTDISYALGWFAGINGSGYETMHDCGLLAYRH